MTADRIKPDQPLSIADARSGLYHVFVRDLELACSIGVHGHELGTTQRVLINLDLAVREGEGTIDDNISNVVCYEAIVHGARRIAGGGHVKLVETLAENLAAMCLEDQRVLSARVRIEKLDAFEDVKSVGVEIERYNP
mgnify:CR=1 FL=1